MKRLILTAALLCAAFPSVAAARSAITPAAAATAAANIVTAEYGNSAVDTPDISVTGFYLNPCDAQTPSVALCDLVTQWSDGSTCYDIIEVAHSDQFGDIAGSISGWNPSTCAQQATTSAVPRHVSRHARFYRRHGHGFRRVR